MSLNQRSDARAMCDPSSLQTEETAILDSLDCAILVADANGLVRYRNPVAANWLERDSKIEAALRPVQPFGSFTNWEAELRRVKESGRSASFIGILRAPMAGMPSVVTTHCNPLCGCSAPSAGGVILRIEETGGCETHENHLGVPDRLASLGKLATRIAHELNNPLDGILRYTTLALKLAEHTQEPKLTSYLNQSRTGLVRMIQIIGELLEMSRATKGEFDQADVNEIMQQALVASEDAVSQAGIVVTVDFQNRKLPALRGTRLYLICCNLIRNAVDAMPDGGRLSITTGQAAGALIIRVADTGVGLPAEPAKLFEPFFTTKRPGKGTGIGLAICKEFVEEMEGSITAEPGSDGGAVFTVKIPMKQGRPDSAHGASSKSCS